MKKFIFTLLLAIVSSVWTTSMALCLGYTNGVYDAMGASTMHTGTIEVIPFPCDGGNDEPCPPCLTLALKQASDGQIYYLTTAQHRYNIQEQLDSIMNIAESANNSYKQWITVVGRIFWRDHNACIDVERIQTNNISSLCDEWSVLQFRSHMGYSPDEYYTQYYQLTSDTVINGQIFRKLYKENSYSGAMREGTNRDIYYVPADSTHEYLLYAFNAQVGDTLTNVWFGTILHYEVHSIKTATIMEIKPTSPKTFVIDVEYWLPNMMDTLHKQKEWIEGVGTNTAPDGGLFEPLAGGFSSILLCAYKNGEQVYVSEWGEQFGCVREDFIEGEFVTLNGNIVASFRECSIDGCPRCFGTFMTQDASFYLLTATDTLIMEQLNMLYLGKQYTIKGVWTKCKNTPFIEVNAIYETKDTIPADTIPLYIKDGPGSSTIEPVDPNEIIAQLIHDELQMKEYLHTIIDYNLTKAPAANSSPAVKHVNPVVAADSFTDSETVTLTESGRYFLEMSHPDWDYTIVGTFVYNALQGLETIENSQSACTKELREGQLLIRQGEQLYTPTGIRIQ